MTISEDVLAAGQPVSTAAPEAIGDALNAALNRFIGNRFTAGRGHIVDLAGATQTDSRRWFIRTQQSSAQSQRLRTPWPQSSMCMTF
jgi:hypothetical protein